METDKSLRTGLVNLLTKENAHVGIEGALKGIPLEKTGIVPKGMPYSIWQLTEHIRISQFDILEFSRNPNYKSPKWPDEYWPKHPAPENESQFNESVQAILRDLNDMADLVRNPENDLFKPFSHGQGQNLFREAVLIIDHNAYHVGQVIVVRRMLDIWP